MRTEVQELALTTTWSGARGCEAQHMQATLTPPAWQACDHAFAHYAHTTHMNARAHTHSHKHIYIVPRPGGLERGSFPRRGLDDYIIWKTSSGATGRVRRDTSPVCM